MKLLLGFRLLACGFERLLAAFHTHRYSTASYPPACIHCGRTITRR